MKIKPFLYVGALGTPIVSLVVLYAVQNHIVWLLYASQFVWGLCFAMIQVSALPFILRNTPDEYQVEAISLSYSTWSFGNIISGLFIFLFHLIAPQIYTDKLALQIVALLGFLSVFFIYNIKIIENVPEKTKTTRIIKADWFLIFKAATPTLIIAVGAGLTIPFIGLFFFKIHEMSSGNFAMLSSITTVFVALSIMAVPYLNNKIGNKPSIILTQAFAIIFLVALAATEFYNSRYFAIFIAMTCYIFRQPLMQMAAPLITDFTMKYVGKRNQELLSAITAAIWSGSWFISSRIFVFLRKADFQYAYIFFITAIIYTIGVIWFFGLMKEHEHNSK